MQCKFCNWKVRFYSSFVQYIPITNVIYEPSLISLFGLQMLMLKHCQLLRVTVVISCQFIASCISFHQTTCSWNVYETSVDVLNDSLLIFFAQKPLNKITVIFKVTDCPGSLILDILKKSCFAKEPQFTKCTVKRVTPWTHWSMEAYIHAFLSSVLRVGERLRSASLPSLHVGQDAVWAPDPDWRMRTGEKSVVFPENRTAIVWSTRI